MPYKTFPEGDKFCNYKIDADGSKTGERIACFPTREEANAQIRALYASEGGKSLVKSEPTNALFSVQKDAAGNYRWIAQFSNNVRDSDDPPEILSAEAHRKFVYLLDKGFVPMPELWLWHEPEWTVGEADWIATDDHGKHVFIVASGTFYDHAKSFAEFLSQSSYDVALSHGMYPHLLERDDADKSIITGYVSREITLLPRFAAANKLTAYMMGESSDSPDEKEKSMVKDKKARSLKDAWPGMDPDLLNRIQEANAVAKSVAEDLELETKENEEETEDETEDAVEGKSANAEATEDTEQGVDGEDTQSEAKESDGETSTEKGSRESDEPSQKAVTYEDMFDVLKAIQSRIDEQGSVAKETADTVKELDNRIRALENKEESRQEATKANGLVDYLMNRSVEGKEETKVDGRTTLGKDGPEENKEKGGSGLFFEEFLS